MLQIKKILFPTDHSACAERAFTRAAFLADWHAAELHALSVIEAEGRQARPLLEELRLSEEEIAEELHMIWRSNKAAPERAEEAEEKLRLITKQVEAPSAPEEILRYAQEQDIDLIVMGTHGRRGARRLLLGSVAEEIVRRAGCPVFTVCTGEKAVPHHAVRRVLVPVDFSEFTHTALAYAVELAQTYGARIDLLHVVEDATRPGVYGEEGWLVVDTDLFKERAYEALAEMAQKEIGFEDVRVAVEVGHPASEIVDYAEQHQADLIVIPTHGLTGLKRLLMGSVAEKVVRLAPCPVFTIKSFGRSLLSAGSAKKARAGKEAGTQEASVKP